MNLWQTSWQNDSISEYLKNYLYALPALPVFNLVVLSPWTKHLDCPDIVLWQVTEVDCLHAVWTMYMILKWRKNGLLGYIFIAHAFLVFLFSSMNRPAARSRVWIPPAPCPARRAAAPHAIQESRSLWLGYHRGPCWSQQPWAISRKLWNMAVNTRAPACKELFSTEKRARCRIEVKV